MRQRKEVEGGAGKRGKEMVDAWAMKQMRSVTEGEKKRGKGEVKDR